MNSKKPTGTLPAFHMNMTATTLSIASVCSPPTDVDDIEPLLERRCIECHQPGEVEPMTFTDFDSAAGWSAMMFKR